MAEPTDAGRVWMQACTEELETEEASTCSECEFKAQGIEHLWHGALPSPIGPGSLGRRLTCL
jgi:hypothetical protein